MEEQIRALNEASGSIFDIHVIKGPELLEERMNLFHAVGRAAPSAPRYIACKYQGNPGSDDIDLAVVGKGLTFDTGGMNLKPTGFIEDMHIDKCGATATIGAMHGVSALAT